MEADLRLTYRQVDPKSFRVSVDGVEIGSISGQSRHVHPVKTYWHWGVDIMPLMSHGGGVPSGDIEPPGGFEDALKAFKEAFTQWRAGIPDDQWRENLEYKRAGQAGVDRLGSCRHTRADVGRAPTGQVEARGYAQLTLAVVQLTSFVGSDEIKLVGPRNTSETKPNNNYRPEQYLARALRCRPCF